MGTPSVGTGWACYRSLAEAGDADFSTGAKLGGFKTRLLRKLNEEIGERNVVVRVSSDVAGVFEPASGNNDW